MPTSRRRRCPVCGKNGVDLAQVLLRDEGDEFSSTIECRECGSRLRGKRSWKLKKTLWVWGLLALVFLPSLVDFGRFHVWQGVAAAIIVVGHFLVSLRPPLEPDDRTD